MNSLFWKYALLAVGIFAISQIQLQGQVENTADVVMPELAKITHLDKTDYKGDSQFWTMVRDTTGVYYFGNNDGALAYDGQEWSDILLPNGSGVRSLLRASNGEIYAGGYNDFGIIKKNDLGVYMFKSISDDLKINTQRLENVWQIHELGNHIIFRTFQGLIAISKNTSSFIPSAGNFLYAGVVNDNYYVQDENSGVMRFDPVSKDFKRIFSEDLLDNQAIIAFLPSASNELIEIVTKSGDIFTGDILSGTLSKKYEVFPANTAESLSVCIKRNNDYILGTLGSKVLVFSEGNLLQKNKSVYDQIQDQTILNLYQDDKDLWVLLNDGLDIISFDSIFSVLFEESSVYDILIKDQKVYIATNNGVYYSKVPDVNSEFEFVKTSIPQGQVWSLSDMGSSILVSHDLGLFELRGDAVIQVGDEIGFWKILPIEGETDNYLACNYNGLFLLKRKNGVYYFETKVAGFEESTRDIIQADEKNIFWVCHGYKGVYRLKFSDDYLRVTSIDHYTDQNGLSSSLGVDVHRWDDNIIFSTNQGIYSFNPAQSIFEPYPKLNTIINSTINSREILEYGDFTWLVLDDQIGYFNKLSKNPAIETDIFTNLKGDLNRGFESILPISESEVFIGAKSGLYLYNTHKSKDTLRFKTTLTKITTQDYAGGEMTQLSLDQDSKMEVSNSLNMLRIEFAAPRNRPMSDVTFSYKLKSLDNEWSSWSKNSFKEFTHLPAGDYEFVVRSQNERGVIGDEASFHFTVKPLWYQTMLAKILFILFVVLFFIMLRKFLNNKLKEERRKSRERLEKSKKVLNLQIQQLKLEQAKMQLEEDVILKSKELTNYTVQLINKKQAFAEVQNDLKELKGLVKNVESKKKLTEIFKKLHQHKIGEEYLQVYDVNFEKIHHDFFKQLKALNPKLTKRELRLCAFIKMNLTNKEIAPLLTISVRGVETARYRVRKKLHITQDRSFTDFLTNL